MPIAFPRKKLQSAMRSALSAKLSENSLAVIETSGAGKQQDQGFSKDAHGLGVYRESSARGFQRE